MQHETVLNAIRILRLVMYISYGNWTLFLKETKSLPPTKKKIDQKIFLKFPGQEGYLN